MSRKFYYNPDTKQVEERSAAVVERSPIARPVVSDALGFGQHQFEEMEADRKLNGFSGVEFVRDPDVPEYYQVKCRDVRARDKYAKHRGFENRNGIGGVRLSLADFARAEELVKRKYGGAE